MRRRRELFIDLTSLLDVILILLFLTICTMNSQATDSKQQAETLAQENQQLVAENATLESQASQLSSENAALSAQVADLQQQLEDSQELQNLSEQELEELASLLHGTRFIDINCVNEADGCRVTIGIRGMHTSEFLITSSDFENPTPRVQVLRDYLSGLLGTREDQVLMFCLNYDNQTIHRYEYQIIVDAIQSTMNGSTRTFLIAESKLPTTQN